MQEYNDYLQSIVLFGLLSIALLWAAKARGFFILPSHSREGNLVTFKTVLSCFVIYLGMTLFIAPLFVKLIVLFAGKEIPMVFFSWTQLGMLFIIFALFTLYCQSQHRHLFSSIWKNRSSASSTSIAFDIFLGLITWFISFPLIMCVGQCVDMLLYHFFNFQSYEQVAVRYLKTTLESPPMLAIALFTILLAAPIIEEFLFRGCLQSYFRKYMTPNYAIGLSALCFSCFHFAPSQGIGNISLIATLFVFALFLGFIYERQRSLFASTALHITFNLVSALRILLFPE